MWDGIVVLYYSSELWCCSGYTKQTILKILRAYTVFGVVHSNALCGNFESLRIWGEIDLWLNVEVLAGVAPTSSGAVIFNRRK